MLQYLDFSHASSTSRKWGHKRQGDGLEAPRNSMEFALEASHSYGVFQEDAPYSCNMKQYPKSGLNHHPVKKLIHEDISFRTNEGQKRPGGVIARLMGMESPPLNTTTTESIISRSEVTPRPTTLARSRDHHHPSETTISSSAASKHVSFVQQHSTKQQAAAPNRPEIRGYGEETRDVFGQQQQQQQQMNKRSSSSDQWSSSKPQPREHPQEEELQKFKKEFEAWQASRAWEQSRSFELESSLELDDDDDDDGRCTDIVPYRYHHHHHHSGKASAGSHGHGSNSKHMLRSADKEEDNVHCWRRSKENSSTSSISGSRTFSLTTSADAAAAACSTRLPLSRFYHEEEERSPSVSSPATRIVILKPCPELSTDDIEESSLVGSPPELLAVKHRAESNNMEAFLEEVKKRLKIELEGGVVSAADDNRRWSADVIPAAADPKQIARSIANQIRENVIVTRERDMVHVQHPALVRSESTRSYRSGDVPQDHFIGRDARRQLSDRLRNVLRRDDAAAETTTAAAAAAPFSFSSHRRSRPASTSFLDEEPPTTRGPTKPPPTTRRQHEAAPPTTTTRKGKVRSKEEKSVSSDVRSFRYGSTATQAAESEPVSPRNLVRSFSAPVVTSGTTTTFVKLLSEEPRVLTGARLQRKHEGQGRRHGSSRPPAAAEEELEERKAQRKEKDPAASSSFSIRGGKLVSNLRQNLGLRAKLFGRKQFHAAADEPFPDDLPPIGVLLTAPSVLIHPGVLQENSTEVPPSPASWCSSPPDEMMMMMSRGGGGYPSPVSPLEASFSEHRSSASRTDAKDMAASAAAATAASEPGIPSSSEQVQQAADEQRAETSPPPVLDDQHDDDDDDGDMDEASDHPVKSFVRALLVAAGMFGRKHQQNPAAAAMSEFEPTKPMIPEWVLEEVVSSSSSSSAPADGGASAADMDHRLLFDLVNEALPGAVRSTTALRAFDRCLPHAAAMAAAAAPPRRRRRAPPGGNGNGNKALLEAVWRSVQQAWLEPPTSEIRTAAAASSASSVDALIGRDLSASPWRGGFGREDGDAVAADVEAEVMDELLDETVWDVLLNVGD